MKQGSVAPAGSTYRWIVLSGICLLYFSFAALTASVSPLVTRISTELSIDYATMGRILGAWQFVYLFTAIPLGISIDYFKPARVLLLASLILALSAFTRSLATDGLTLWLAVALFGFGGPLISIGSPKIIGYWFDGRQRGFAMGLYGACMFLGGISALTLTNSVYMPLLEGDWRQYFRYLALFMLLVGMLWWLISRHFVSQGVAVPAQRSRALHDVPVLLRSTEVRLVLALGACIFAFTHGMGSWLPTILQHKGLTAAQAGLWAALPDLFGFFASLLIPTLAVANRRFRVLLILSAVAVLATGLMQLQFGSPLIVALVLLGMVRGAMMTVSMLMLMEMPAVGVKRIGIAGGLYFTIAEMGGFSGPAGMGWLYDASGGFVAPLLMATGVALLMMMLLGLLGQRMRSEGE